VESSVLGIGAKILRRTLNFETWKNYSSILRKEANRAWREYKMLVFTGVEYTRNTFENRNNAHILALDIKQYVPPTFDETTWLEGVKNQNALTIAAHPLKLKDASSQTYYLLENEIKLSPLLDCWEVANHKTIWRDMLRKPHSLIASSDFHGHSNWAAWRTKIPCEKDPEAVKAHLKNKKSAREFVYIYGHKNEISYTVSPRERW
jgi:hypothetical protein